MNHLLKLNDPLILLQMEQIRADIREFRQSSGVDKVIVLWTANTERFCDITPGVNDTAKNLLAAIQVRWDAKRWSRPKEYNVWEGYLWLSFSEKCIV